MIEFRHPQNATSESKMESKMAEIKEMEQYNLGDWVKGFLDMSFEYQENIVKGDPDLTLLKHLCLAIPPWKMARESPKDQALAQLRVREVLNLPFSILYENAYLRWVARVLGYRSQAKKNPLRLKRPRFDFERYESSGSSWSSDSDNEN